MPDEPQLYARYRGHILEIVTDRLTLRLDTGDLVAIEDYLKVLLADARELRIMTLDEAPFVLQRYRIAPPLACAA
ncbi:hypothetical protein E8L99_11710 [Phreatobacter aquaticus]|uniref:Uncharacterized protein n=1 Tax=Phreatobacter aquaticus TaxID=2570229 RepID=A0A4D7QEF9_9HYPH|nr:hypothetical protein [Phreatobacter aquaticus]QCK86370.1 hypothetical protein E8L99_11710 [Phreatobacter aquaticus]